MAEVILTNHIKYRLYERNIDVHDTKKIAKNGKVTKTDIDGTITKHGICSNGRPLSVVTIEINNKLIIKTAYYEDKI